MRHLKKSIVISCSNTKKMNRTKKGTCFHLNFVKKIRLNSFFLYFRHQLVFNSYQNFRHEGLNSLKYKVIRTIKYKLYTNIIVTYDEAAWQLSLLFLNSFFWREFSAFNWFNQSLLFEWSNCAKCNFLMTRNETVLFKTVFSMQIVTHGLLQIFISAYFGIFLNLKNNENNASNILSILKFLVDCNSSSSKRDLNFFFD